MKVKWNCYKEATKAKAFTVQVQKVFFFLKRKQIKSLDIVKSKHILLLLPKGKRKKKQLQLLLHYTIITFTKRKINTHTKTCTLHIHSCIKYAEPNQVLFKLPKIQTAIIKGIMWHMHTLNSDFVFVRII